MAIFMIILSLIFVYLYILNIYKLFENGITNNPLIVVVRILGIVFPYLGVILGLIPN